MKNNQPTTVLVSVKEYRDTKKKAAKWEERLDKMENIRLLKLAESRDDSHSTSFEAFVKEQGFSIDEYAQASVSGDYKSFKSMIMNIIVISERDDND